MAKRLLLILPCFYGYENEIITALTTLDCIVDVIIENLPSISYFYRFVDVYCKEVRDKIYNEYYHKKLKNNFVSKYDIVLVIRGQTISREIIYELRETNSDACFVLYEWDSVKNNPNAARIADLFDRVYTFDSLDAKENQWDYRPLFFSREFKRDNDRPIDLALIGKIHSERLSIFNIIKDDYVKYKSFIYLFERRLVYYKQKYINKSPEYTGVDDSSVKFKSLKLEETFDIYSKSNILIDYTHPNQNGFTMRTIESIGSRCKLITNNKKVLDADFYNESNIYYYKTGEFKIPDSFVKSPYCELSESTYEKYSIIGWIKELIGYEKN